MSVNTSSPDDLAERISKIESEVNELISSINKARGLRWVFLLALLGIIVAIVIAFSGLARRVTSKEYLNELGTLAQKHYEDNQKRYMDELQVLSDKATPVIAKAFSEQMTKDLPKLTQTLDSERDTFIANIQTKMDDRLSKQYNDLLSQHEKIIVKNFPELEDQETRSRVIASLQMILEKIIARNFGDQFRQQANEIVEIWESFPAADEPQAGEIPLEQKLLTNVLFVASNVMTAIESNNGDFAPPSTAHAVAPPSDSEGAVPGTEPAPVTRTEPVTPVETETAEPTPEATKPSDPPQQ